MPSSIAGETVYACAEFRRQLRHLRKTLMSTSYRCPTNYYHYLVVGDFNSHSQSWGYDHIDKRGEEVENWQDDHKLNLINKPEDQPTFYSRRWRTTSTPDLKLKPTHHKTITVTYNIPRPDFSGTSYNPGGKAGETKQHHSTWRKMLPCCGD